MNLQTPAIEKPFDVDVIRRDFPILTQQLANGKPLVYLDTAASSQKPRCVIDKMVECLEEYNSNVHRGIHQLGDRMTTELENAREIVRRFINARDVDEIIFTSGTTMSLNMVAHGWAKKFLKPGDEILVNAMEHHANLVPWQLAAKATGATLRFLPLTEDGRLDLTRLNEFLTSRTKLVAVTAMSNVLGTINPIKDLSSKAHAVGALICVDGAQSAPHALTDVVADDIDFLAFSGHKLYGPTGIGVLFGKKKLLDAMDPFLFGGHMIREVFEQTSSWAEPPAKFEAGTCPFVEAVALGTAIDYVQTIGLARISEYEHRLSVYAHEKLSRVKGVRILGPDVGFKGAILSFVIDGLHPHDLSDLLDREGVAIRAGHHCTMPLHDLLGISSSARASFAVYNTTAEADAFVSAVENAKKVFRLN